MRAIALDGSLTTRIRKDEQRYTLNEAASKFWEMGYDITPSPRGPMMPPWNPPWNPQSDIGAELQTKCGCTKRMFVPRGMRKIRIACRPGDLSLLEPFGQVTVDVREFELRRIDQRDGLPVAIFVETK